MSMGRNNINYKINSFNHWGGGPMVMPPHLYAPGDGPKRIYIFIHCNNFGDNK